MSVQRTKFATQMETTKLETLRKLAKDEGRQLQVLLEEAVDLLIQDRTTYKMHPDIRDAYEATLEQFPKTLEMLAK